MTSRYLPVFIPPALGLQIHTCVHFQLLRDYWRLVRWHFTHRAISSVPLNWLLVRCSDTVRRRVPNTGLSWRFPRLSVAEHDWISLTEILGPFIASAVSRGVSFRSRHRGRLQREQPVCLPEEQCRGGICPEGVGTEGMYSGWTRKAADAFAILWIF